MHFLNGGALARKEPEHRRPKSTEYFVGSTLSHGPSVDRGTPGEPGEYWRPRRPRDTCSAYRTSVVGCEVRVLHDPPRERPSPAIQVEPEDRVVVAKVVGRVPPDRVIQRLMPGVWELFRFKEARLRQLVVHVDGLDSESSS